MSLPHTSERNDNIAFIEGGPSCDDITVMLRRYVVVCRVCVYALTSDLDWGRLAQLCARTNV